MSWSFSPALVAAFSEATSLDTGRSAPSSSTPTPDQFYWPDKPTEHSRLSRYGMTCEPLTVDRGADLLTWYREVSLAKTSAQQEPATASTGNAVGSGRKWLGLLARFDHDSRAWRTPQCSLLGDSDEFSETWPRWGSMRTGECWERETAVLPTVANESGFLPTPRASVGTHGICWKRAKDGNHRSQIEDYLGWLSLEHGGQVTSGRTVNAEFQDWLMEWPSQWTDLKPLATGKFQQWLQQHGKS